MKRGRVKGYEEKKKKLEDVKVKLCYITLSQSVKDERKKILEDWRRKIFRCCMITKRR